MVQDYSLRIPLSRYFLCLLILFCISPIAALNVYGTTPKQADYVEGKLYVEIKTRYQSMNWEYDQELHKPKHHGLRRWILQYQITKIEKLDVAKAKNAYYFYFKKSHLTESFIETLTDLPYIKKVKQIAVASSIYIEGEEASISTFVEPHRPNLVLVPTAFSPNNDGSNDYFQVKGQNIAGYELQIFNRLGETIYQLSESDVYGWDGTVNGRGVPAGIYAYYGWVRFENEETKVLKGYLTLMQ